MPFITRTALAVALPLAALPVPAHAQEPTPNAALATPSAPVVVLEFIAEDAGSGADMVKTVLEMGGEPRISRLAVSAPAGESATLDGALVFDGLEAFASWRENAMEGFFRPLGGVEALHTTLRLFRADLLSQSRPEGAGGAVRDVTVSYRNTDNDAAGDSDIDAVTVVCPGDHADCKPSN